MGSGEMMQRRTFLRSGAAITSGALFPGCLGFETQSVWRDPPLVADRPNGVYYPEIVEGTGMYGTTTAGDLGFGLMHSYPHRFWNLTGSRRSKVVVRPDDTVHLMARVWDRETETILPVDVSTEITDSEGGTNTTNLWPMISPTMGFHYGDNVQLAGEGTYDVTLRVGPLQVQRTEPFEGRFTNAQSVTMNISFDPSDTYDLEIRRVNEKAGTRGTVDLVEMDTTPIQPAPKKSELPGQVLHEGHSGDATMLFGLVEGENRFRDEAGQFLYVSARTPYNRIPLPQMGLKATISRSGEAILEEELHAALDPMLGPFYGVRLEEIQRGDSVNIGVETPPQLARHDGYETAFIDMDSIEFVVG